MKLLVRAVEALAGSRSAASEGLAWAVGAWCVRGVRRAARWENLFKKRKIVHVDAVKEFYAKRPVIHLKKKDVVKSSVKGIDIEFDHEKLAAILGVPGKNGIREYIEDVWEESKYTKPLEITRRVANNETLTVAEKS
ncbi:hypothetical protein Dimus_013225 [Dionaea muscipula]